MEKRPHQRIRNQTAKRISTQNKYQKRNTFHVSHNMNPPRLRSVDSYTELDTSHFRDLHTPKVSRIKNGKNKGKFQIPNSKDFVEINSLPSSKIQLTVNNSKIYTVKWDMSPVAKGKRRNGETVYFVKSEITMRSGNSSRSIDFICDMKNIPSSNNLNSMQKEMLARVFADEFYSTVTHKNLSAIERKMVQSAKTPEEAKKKQKEFNEALERRRKELEAKHRQRKYNN